MRKYAKRWTFASSTSLLQLTKEQTWGSLILYYHHKITLRSWCSISWKLWASWIHNSSLLLVVLAVKDLDDNNCAVCKDLQWLNLNGKVRFLWTITTHNNRSFGVLKEPDSWTSEGTVLLSAGCVMKETVKICWQQNAPLSLLLLCIFSEPYVQLKPNKKFPKKNCYFCKSFC